MKDLETIGMLKMDFLGLKTLSIIKDAVANIKESRGIDIDIDQIPMDDTVTFELYSRGETTGLFQFESPGMKKYLKDLKPNRFEDLIAMNALYRPGPMEYIPSFINRKHGKEKIEYDLPEMEEYLLILGNTATPKLFVGGFFGRFPLSELYETPDALICKFQLPEPSYSKLSLMLFTHLIEVCVPKVWLLMNDTRMFHLQDQWDGANWAKFKI